MMMRTYVNINNELTTYNYKIISYPDKKHRTKCVKCNSYLKTIYIKKFNKQTTLGYYCELCKIGFLDKTTGKYFNVELKKTKSRRI